MPAWTCASSRYCVLRSTLRFAAVCVRDGDGACARPDKDRHARENALDIFRGLRRARREQGKFAQLGATARLTWASLSFVPLYGQVPSVPRATGICCFIFNIFFPGIGSILAGLQANSSSTVLIGVRFVPGDTLSLCTPLYVWNARQRVLGPIPNFSDGGGTYTRGARIFC
jgi:hypothetical protein